MNKESKKRQRELAVFKAFVNKYPANVAISSIESGDANKKEPDIKCSLNNETIYFELTEACAPEIAQSISKGSEVAIWVSDVSEITLKNKLSKKYNVTEPVELLIYIDGRTVLPDDCIIDKALSELQMEICHFSKVWLMGDEVHLLFDGNLK